MAVMGSSGNHLPDSQLRGGGGGEGLEDGRGACVGGWWWEAGDRLPLPVPLPTDCIPAFEEV